MEEKEKKRKGTFLVRCGEVGGACASTAAAGEGAVVRIRRGGKGRGLVDRDWSNLPKPVVYLILKGLLPALADVFSMGDVCKAWWSVFTDCKAEIFSCLPPVIFRRCPYFGALDGFYNLMEGRSCRRKAPMDFPFGTPDHPQWRFIGVSYGFWILRSERPLLTYEVVILDPMTCSPVVAGVHLPGSSSGLDGAIMTAPPMSPDCVVVGVHYGGIQYCRPGDAEWTCLTFGQDSGMAFAGQLVAARQGKAYALTTVGDLVVIEFSPQPSFTVVKAKGSPRVGGYASGLTEFNGEILYVSDLRRLRPDFPLLLQRDKFACVVEHRFVVRRLDLPAGKWTKLSTLGGRALFLGVGTSLMCDVAKWSGMGDCIYCPCWTKLLVFHVKDGTAEHHPLPDGYIAWDWVIPSFCHQ